MERNAWFKVGMIPEAREVRVSRKGRQELERRCRSPRMLQRDLKRARIVLLAAAGRSSRSIAKEVDVEPRIVSRWCNRFVDEGLAGLDDKPRPGKKPLYTKATDKRIQEHIDAFIRAYNEAAQPFTWTKKKVRQRRFKGSRITQL